MLSVVIPAFNEAAAIEKTLSAIGRALRKEEWEAVVVDDGSEDGTAEKAEGYASGHPEQRIRVLRLLENRGKGEAVRAGLLAARGDMVAYLDADLDIPPRELCTLKRIMERKEWDIAVGSKRHLALFGSPIPFYRRVVSLVFSRVVRLLFAIPVRDTQTGIKVMRGAVVRRVAPLASESGFLFDVEILAYAHAMGFRIGEVPVQICEGERQRRIGLWHIWRSILELAGMVHRVRMLIRHLARGRHEEGSDAASHAFVARD